MDRASQDPQYKRLNTEIADLADCVREQLGSSNAELLEQLLARIYDLQLIETGACFNAGFL